MWYQRQTIYHIYPRSFFDSNGDGIGDIPGIIRKLDYIRELGFETIWISPFFRSPQRDFGYDIADYFSIAPEFGTLEDVETLIRETHQRDMKIVFDIVMNHTSDQHPWFLESRSSRDNPKADWYIWRDKPNNWKSIVGPKGWQYCKERDQYYFASFFPFQPDLNYRNEAVKKSMFDMCRFWLRKGVDGFRLDIFNCIIKDQSFRDNPFSLLHIAPSPEYPGGNFQIRKYSLNQPENFELARELRSVVDEFAGPPRFLIGEVFGTHDKIKQFLGGKQDGLHLVFLFDILFFKFSASFFRKKILEFEHHYPAPDMPTVVFSNHDQLRSIRILGNNMEKAKVIALLQFTLRCVPVVYYGEEIGMTNGKIPLKEAKDAMPDFFRWMPQWLADRLPAAVNRDVCRTPMQWDRSKNAGFSTATSWLPVNRDLHGRNVEEQSADPHSLLRVYSALNSLRRSRPALHSGKLEILNTGNKHILAYTRTHQEETLLVLLNFSKKRIANTLSRPLQEVLFSLNQPALKDGVCTLDAYGGIVLKIG